MKIFIYPCGLLPDALCAFLFSRALILLIIVITTQLKFNTVPAREGINYDPTALVEMTSVRESLARVFLSADASWYIGIATAGYPHKPSPSDVAENWTFFPLVPLLQRGLFSITGSYLLAGLIISNFAFLAGLFVLDRLMSLKHYTPKLRSRVLWLLCFFPTSYFFIPPLTESLFFLLLVGVFYLLETKNFYGAALCAALLCATRPTGLFVMPAFAVELLRAPRPPWRVALVTLLIAPLGGLLYSAYLWHITGDALAFVHNQIHWSRTGSYASLLRGLLENPRLIMIPWNFILMNLVFALAALAMAARYAQSRQWSFALILALPVLIAASTGTTLSMTRFIMVLFPFVLGLAQWANTDVKERMLLVVSSGLLALMTAMYALHVTAAMA